MNPIKIIVMGHKGVGKSSIVRRYVQNVFTDHYDPTIEDLYRKKVTVHDMEYDIEILDTMGLIDDLPANKENSFIHIDKYYSLADSIILVISMTTEKSLITAYTLYNKIKLTNPNIPIILCANKCHCTYNRNVTVRSVKTLAHELGCDLFFVSAMLDTNIKKSFEYIVTEVIKSDSYKNKVKNNIKHDNDRTRHFKLTKFCLLL